MAGNVNAEREKKKKKNGKELLFTAVDDVSIAEEIFGRKLFYRWEFKAQEKL